MTMYLLRNGSLAMDLGRRAEGCLYVHRLDLGLGCWIPRGLIRLRLNAHQVEALARDGQVPIRAAS
ncbi:MAG: hypothetical protein MK116_02040 [Phycisphaerales bacterium]|nr:hypothetical protein [Phycisphaerales bacterium]